MDVFASRGSPPPSMVHIQNVYKLSSWETSPHLVRREMLDFLYGRLAEKQLVPVGIIELGWMVRGDGLGVTVQMRVPTAPMLMDFAEHVEEFDV